MATLEVEDDLSARVHVVGSSGRPSQGFFGRMRQARRDAAALRAEHDYAGVVSTASSEDFSDLDLTGFLTTGARDKDNRPLVCIVSRNFQAKVLNLDRVYRYLVHKLDQLADEPYTLIWFHTGSTYWRNCPSLTWLWRTYERLPSKYRTNLHRLLVVHCDMPLWVGLATLAPMVSEALWRKVEWISRVEFLLDYVDKKQLAVPDFVAKHDSVLEDQPLMDYGVVATKELNSVPGMPGPI